MNIPRDKQLHFLAGIGITFLVSLLTRNLYIGTAVGVAAGPAKELWDWAANKLALGRGMAPTHTVDFWDAFATILGASTPLVILFFYS